MWSSSVVAGVFVMAALTLANPINAVPKILHPNIPPDSMMSFLPKKVKVTRQVAMPKLIH